MPCTPAPLTRPPSVTPRPYGTTVREADSETALAQPAGAERVVGAHA